MPSDQLSSYGSSLVRDRNGLRICNLAGLQIATDSVTSLREIRAGTERALQELDAAREKALFFDKALMVARYTKAACDGFLGLAAKLSGERREVF